MNDSGAGHTVSSINTNNITNSTTSVSNQQPIVPTPLPSPSASLPSSTSQQQPPPDLSRQHANQLLAQVDSQQRGFAFEDEIVQLLMTAFPRLPKSDIKEWTKEAITKEHKKKIRRGSGGQLPNPLSGVSEESAAHQLRQYSSSPTRVPSTDLNSSTVATKSDDLSFVRQRSDTSTISETQTPVPVNTDFTSPTPLSQASNILNGVPGVGPISGSLNRLSSSGFIKLAMKLYHVDHAATQNQTVVLITSCMQNDFFHRFPRRRDSMNRYWVGRKDSERVLGFDPTRGPFAQLMNYIRGLATQQQQQQLAAKLKQEKNQQAQAAMAAAFKQMGADRDSSPEPPSIPDAPNLSPSLSDDDQTPQFHPPEDPPPFADSGDHTPVHRNPSPHAEDDPDEDEFNHEVEETEETTGMLTPVPYSQTKPLSSPTVPHTQTNSRSLIATNHHLTTNSSPALRVDLHANSTRPQIMNSTLSHLIQSYPTPNPSSSNPTALQLPLSSDTLLTPTLTGLAHLSPRPIPRTIDFSQLPPTNGQTQSNESASSFVLPPPMPSVNNGIRTLSSSYLSSSSIPQTPIHVIHLRASIDHTKNRGRQAIERYGEYCLAGSEGAKLCCDLEDSIDRFPNETIIDTTRTLTSNSYRPLLKKLRELSLTSTGPLRVAVIGGWTDEDVYHISYELKTRTKAIDIATCSVLTASPSTSQHWNALGQMKRVMGVTVTRTVRELVHWFGVGMNSSPFHPSGLLSTAGNLSSTDKYWPTFIWNLNGQTTHTPPKEFRPDVDGEILAHLYRNSSKIIIDILVGDFSKAVVLGIRSYDKAQVREAPSVLKIADAEDIATEYQAFHRVEEMLGNNAPMMRGFVELANRAGIKFRYTRMTGGKVSSMADLFNDLASQTTTIQAALNEVYQEIFNPWYAGARLEFFDLFAYYFDGYTLSLGRVWGRVKKVDRVHCDSTYLQQFITYCLVKKGTDPAPKHDSHIYRSAPYTEATFRFPDCDHDSFQNLGLLFDKPSGVPYLRTLPPQKLYSCFSHGNASLENFMCEGAATNNHSTTFNQPQQTTQSSSQSNPTNPSNNLNGFNSSSSLSSNSSSSSSSGLSRGGNVWIVDYFYTESRNHCLRDLARTWCCIMYAATEINNDYQFAQAILITHEIARARDLSVPLNPVLMGLTDIHLRTIYSILLNLWSHAGRIVKDRSSASQFQIGLLADSMRFFLYRARNIYSKRWALATSVLLLESILIQEKRIHDIKPSWIPIHQHTQLAAGVLRGQLGLTRCPGHRDFLRFEKKQPHAHTPSTLTPACTDPSTAATAASASNPLCLTPATSSLLTSSSSPLVRAARYSATNPSLLPPNEDRKREEQKERDQLIKQQQEQQAKDEEEEERRLKQQAEANLNEPNSLVQQSIVQTSPSPGIVGDASISSNPTSIVVPLVVSISPVSVNSSPPSASTRPPLHELTTEQRSQRKKAEAEQERANEYARVLSEQQAETARFTRVQTQKQQLVQRHGHDHTTHNGNGTNQLNASNINSSSLRLSGQDPSAAAISDLQLLGRSPNPPPDILGDAEIEAEMLAAAEIERIRDVEAATTQMRRKKQLAEQQTATTTSSCDLLVPNVTTTSQPPHLSRRTTGPMISANERGDGLSNTDGLLSLPSSTTLTASFSSPHLAGLIDSSTSQLSNNRAQRIGGSPKNQSERRVHFHSTTALSSATTTTNTMPIPSLPPLPTSSSAASLVGLLSSHTGAAQLSRIQREVAKLAREGTTHIILLLSDSDFKEMGVDQVQLESAIKEQGMKQLRVHVPTGPLLPLTLLIDLVQVSMSVLCDPHIAPKLLLISKSGFHRAGTLAACILCAFGLPVDRSIRIVRDARGSRSLGRESRDQLVAKFDVAFRRLLIQQVLNSGELFQTSKPGPNQLPTNQNTLTIGNNHGEEQPAAGEGEGMSDKQRQPPIPAAANTTNLSTNLNQSVLDMSSMKDAPTQQTGSTPTANMPPPPSNRSQITVWPINENE